MSTQPRPLKDMDALQQPDGSVFASGCTNILILLLSKYIFARRPDDVSLLSKVGLLQLGLTVVVRKKLRNRNMLHKLSLNNGVAILPHDPPNELTTIEVPSEQLQLVPKEKLLVGQQVYHHAHQGDSHEAIGGVMHHGIWDGDAVIHVTEPRCSCPICEAAARFNEENDKEKNGRKFERGDHLYTQCEDNILRRPMYHHGIYDGRGYVYHFAKSSPKTDLAFEKCEECRVRGAERRKILIRRGLGLSGVRKSCLYCFAEQNPSIGCVQYSATFMQRMANRVIPGKVSMRKSRSPEEVVNKAKMFFDDNSFGEYSTAGVSHNCEAFAYFCKTGFYGAKQVTHSLLHLICSDECIFPVLNLLFVAGVKTFMHARGYRKILHAVGKAKKANERHPHLVPSMLVPAKLYVEVDSDS